MPELPEVETTRRGIEPHVAGRTVTKVIVRQPQLRWPVPASLAKQLPGLSFGAIKRRAKYLLLEAGDHHLMMHLGMSGRLRVLPANHPPGKHDHLDIVLDNGQALRFNDPRRFGAVLWFNESPEDHELIQHLGPEPLSDHFDGNLLHTRSRGRKVAVKNFIMDGKVVVGVGNIYANEALHLAGIRPSAQAGKISKARYLELAHRIKQVLKESLEQGGTTLRDYVGVDGGTGYFQLKLRVYGKSGEQCSSCQDASIKSAVLGQRSTFYCPACQKA